MADRFWICVPCLAISRSDQVPCAHCGNQEFAEGVNQRDLRFEEIETWTKDMAQHAPAHVWLVTRWVRSLRRLTRRVLTAEASEDDTALFWIRLASTINEIPEELEIASSLREAAQQGSSGFRTQLMLSQKTEVLEAARAIGTQLSREEHIYLDYRRQCAAHLTQESYRVKPRRDGRGGHTLREVRRVPWLGADVAFADVWAVVAGLEAAAGGELGVARHVAARSFAIVEDLCQKQELFHVGWG